MNLQLLAGAICASVNRTTGFTANRREVLEPIDMIQDQISCRIKCRKERLLCIMTGSSLVWIGQFLCGCVASDIVLALDETLPYEEDDNELGLTTLFEPPQRSSVA